MSVGTTVSPDNPAKAVSGGFDAVYRLFQRFPPGSMLDVGCGQGALAWELEQLGFAVSCCDIDSERFKLENTRFEVANLNRDRLSYADGEFVYVACVGVLHRLSNIDHALSEMKRVLNDDGRIVIGTPNYQNTLRRMRFLVLGSIGRNVDAPHFAQITAEPEANFRCPLLLSRLENAFAKQGLEIERVTANRIARGSLLFLPLTLLIMVYGLLRRLFILKGPSYKFNFSRHVLFGGKHLVIVVRKTERYAVQRGKTIVQDRNCNNASKAGEENLHTRLSEEALRNRSLLFPVRLLSYIITNND